MPNSPAAAARPPLTVRSPRFDYRQVPKHWHAGSAAFTAMSNGVNMLFPAGERFFVRSVRAYLDRYVDDPARLAEIRAFFGQEGAHANAHERYNEMLEAQGYRVRPFLAWYEDLAYAKIVPRLPSELRLSVTAALEHFTALMAARGIEFEMFDHMDPVMGDLLTWHALEELEHKAVAFDVLADVNPSYVLRVTGMVLAALGLGGFWLAATRYLLHQEGLGTTDLLAGLRAEREALAKQSGREAQGVVAGIFLAGIAEYLRPGFHPSQNDDEALEARARARLGAWV